MHRMFFCCFWVLSLSFFFGCHCCWWWLIHMYWILFIFFEWFFFYFDFHFSLVECIFQTRFFCPFHFIHIQWWSKKQRIGNSVLPTKTAIIHFTQIYSKMTIKCGKLFKKFWKEKFTNLEHHSLLLMLLLDRSQWWW